MPKEINSDLLRGNINTIILSALYSGDRYGYDIVSEIEQKSHGQFSIKQPTLYSCLKRLEAQGYVPLMFPLIGESNRTAADENIFRLPISDVRFSSRVRTTTNIRVPLSIN